MQAIQSRQPLHALILLNLIATALLLTSTFIFDRLLPAELSQFKDAHNPFENMPLGVLLVLLVLFLIPLGLNVIGLVGMWWCHGWARLMFTATTALVLVVGAVIQFIDPSGLIDNPVEATLGHVADLLGGLLLGLVWFGMGDAFAAKRTQTSPNTIWGPTG